MRKRTVAVGILFATTFLSTAALQAAETLAIGAPLPLSGPGAAWGISMQHVVEMAAKEVNDAGGLKVAGKTYTLKVIPYDTKYQANEAVTVVNRLISSDHVKYFVGPMGSATLLAAQPLLKQNGAVAITLAFTPKATNPENPGIFRVSVGSQQMAMPQISWLVKHKNLKNVIGLVENDETGHAMEVDTARAYKENGVAYRTEFFERNSVDFVSILTRALAGKVDAIELSGMSPTTAGLVVKQSRELGYAGLIVRTGGPATQEIVNVAGKKAAEGLYLHAPTNPSDPVLVAFKKKFEATYKHPMNGFAPFYYDGFNMMLQAMRTANTVDDTIKVRDAMASLKNFQGVLGKVEWTGAKTYGIDRQISVPFYIAQLRDGQEVVIAKCTIDRCE
ncbi:MAG: ABC transporter substrate-binding protein [Burkholderiaceae bacterium]|nr:ABC transporter substrate-binding protein [Burkholderiaceae bacterium]